MPDPADTPPPVDRGDPPAHPIALRNGGLRKPVRFDLVPDAGERALLAEYLDLTALSGLRLQGVLSPAGKSDVVLEARLTATAVQPCSVTLAPVTTLVDEAVTRRYVADWAPPEGDEAELPEDVNVEPLPSAVDVMAVAAEALALALPLYPRAPGVELGEAVFAPPGVAPLRTEDLRPFAGLATLKARLQAPDDDTGNV